MLVGMTGTGGGALTVPVLIFWAGLRPIAAVGTSLVFMIGLKSVGAWQHYRLGNIDGSLVRLLAFGSVPGALVGTLAVSPAVQMTNSQVDTLVSRLLGLMLIVTALAMFVRLLPIEHQLSRLLGLTGMNAGTAGPRFSITLGFAIGVLVSLTSVGGGTLLVAALALRRDMPGRKIVGTDVAHALILSAVASAGHIGAQNVDVSIVAGLSLGAIPGVLVGARLTTRVPDRVLYAILGSVITAAGLRLLWI